MKNSKNNRTAVLLLILLGLLILAYKVIFVSPGEDLFIEGNIMASSRVEGILMQVESINFDTNVLQDEKFKSLKSIETPLISLPIGRRNPFSGSY